MPYDPNTMTQVDFNQADSELEAQLAFVERSNSSMIPNNNGSAAHNHLSPPYASSAERKPSNTLLRAAIFGIPLVVGLIIAFLAGSGSNVGSTVVGDSDSSRLPSPPSNLNELCDLGDGSRSSVETCRRACEVADCCDFPANLALSCLAGNEHKCLSYREYCHVLEDVDNLGPDSTPNSIPTAPLNLQGICSAPNLVTPDGFQECQQACSPAACCYDKSAPKCDFAECSTYAPCLTLAAVDHVHPDIPLHVEQHCNAGNILSAAGRAGCRNVCSHALCCFVDGGGGGSSCPMEEPAGFCEQYQACNTLEADLGVEATAKEIREHCLGLPVHQSLCEVICERGQCCFLPEGCSDLFPDLECSSYDPCKDVYGGNVRSDDTAGDPTQTNSNDETSASGGADDSNETDGGGTGAVGGGDDASDSTDASQGTAGEATAAGTAIGSSSTNAAFALKIQVDKACKGFSPTIQDAELAECPKLCADKECCFRERGCSDSSLDCSIYAECSAIYGDAAEAAVAPDEGIDDGSLPTVQGQEDNDIEIVSGPDDAADSEEAESDSASKLYGFIVAACEEDNDVSLCKELCESGSCCFDAYDCPTDDTNCSDYTACQSLYVDTSGGQDGAGDEYTWEDIRAACSDAAVSSMCSTMCEPARCCFPSQNCEIGSDFDCEKYEHCAPVY